MVRTNAAGPGAVGEADHTWAEFAALMEESKADTEQALAEAGAYWEGLAVEAMTSGVTPLAQWAGDASTAGSASNDSVRQVGESFAHTAYSMPEPVEVTSTANSEFGGVPAGFVHLFGGQTDQDGQEREAQQAKQRAVELMRAYSVESGSAMVSVGRFVPPQPIAVSVPPPTITPGQVNSTGDQFVWQPKENDSRRERTPGTTVESLTRVDPPVGSDGSSPGQRPDQVRVGSADGWSNTHTSGAGPVTPVSPTGGSTSNPVHMTAGGNPIVQGLGPVTGVPIDPRTGRPFPGTGSRGPGGGDQGRGGGSGRQTGNGVEGDRARSGRGTSGGVGTLGDDGHRTGSRGGVGQAAEHAGGARGSSARAGSATGPMGGGAGAKGEEDGEHLSPSYLVDQHDDFWDDSPAVSPPVIGA